MRKTKTFKVISQEQIKSVSAMLSIISKNKLPFMCDNLSLHYKKNKEKFYITLDNSLIFSSSNPIEVASQFVEMQSFNSQDYDDIPITIDASFEELYGEV